MSVTITIDKRFVGPPGCGNGGYVCGRVAAFVGNPASVRLHVPIPLDLEMTVEQVDGGQVQMTRNGAVQASGRPAADDFDIEVPALPDAAEIEQAMENYVGHRRHPFITCFVCGPKREPGDALRIFPGPVEGRELVASAWTPDPGLACDDGLVEPVYVWATLDCPGGWAAVMMAERLMVLGMLTARIHKRPRPGEPCVTMGWPLHHDDRKYHVGSALLSASGEIYARAKAVWVGVGAVSPS